MFLHVGDDVVVSLKDLVLILDVHSAGQAEETRSFLRRCAAEGRVLTGAQATAKSVVVTRDGIHYSPISSLTLAHRAEVMRQTLPGRVVW